MRLAGHLSHLVQREKQGGALGGPSMGHLLYQCHSMATECWLHTADIPPSLRLCRYCLKPSVLVFREPC